MGTKSGRETGLRTLSRPGGAPAEASRYEAKLARQAVPLTAALGHLARYGAPVEYDPDWMGEHFGDPGGVRAWSELQRTIEYPHEALQTIRRPFGRGERTAIPRRHAAYGDPGTDYRFSGCRLPARPWTPLLSRLRSALEQSLGAAFNFVLVNLYRSGADCMGWHADDEAELGEAPVIASLSFGATRDFQLRRVEGFAKAARGGPTRGTEDEESPPLAVVTLPLASGSLLVMRPPTQALWRHQLPRRGGRYPQAIGPRLNLTFRNLRPGSFEERR